ncbi:MAG: DUF4886 domain-containing protein, partial [Muribaculaceae bacterium]|nr:DUF4886 domain-containing protein [Muribaculaceae bacterium]
MKFRYILLSLALFAGYALQARTVRVLAIGNSFSHDAVEQYLHELAEADGDTMIIGNMFIQGCPLERHVNNIREDKAAYEYRKIGVDGKRVVSKGKTLKDGLADENWDYISFQQASKFSGKYDTYSKSLPELMEYVKKNGPRKYVPVLHQTWAYKQGADHSGFKLYGDDQMTMYRAIVDANNRAAKLGRIKVIVPSGTAIQNARTSFIGDNMNRDGYHLDLAHGRFTAACTWYEKLMGRDVTRNGYVPEGMNPDIASVAKKAAHEAVA